jgi:hypothetical protein
LLLLFLASALALSAGRALAIEPTSAPERLQAARAVKDSLFRTSEESPIPAAARSTFPGLRYFPYDPQYRFVGELHVYGRRKLIEVPATGGQTLPMERYGRFIGRWEGTPFSLEVYRGLEDGALLVLFRDGTTGRETYGGGRYAPLETAPGSLPVLDLNRAYHPYCAYNESYVCPLPPARNRLPFPALAGERLALDGAEVAR